MCIGYLIAGVVCFLYEFKKSKMFKIFIWLATVSYAIANFVNNEENPYIQALHRRPWANIHGYLEVRPGAHLFYWFYYADGSMEGASRKPIIIWIQGGPGFAASGVGNFAELGPLNMKLEPRNHTWVKGRNVLFIDHPVGAGFSYATDKSLFVKTDREMAIDLSRAIKMFFRKHKELRKAPTYLIGQSYGGKITARLGFYLETAIEKKSLKMNLKGIAIGGGWVDPKESSIMQPEFLYNSGAIDRNTYLVITRLVRKMSRSIDRRDYATTGDLNDIVFTAINNDNDINFNNLNTDSPYPALEELTKTINRYVKPTLQVNQSLQWIYLSTDAYNNLKNDFFIPTVSFLEALLNSTKLKIAVYNGNLDIITPLSGASNWVHKLNWDGAKEFSAAKRIKIRGKRNGFYKEAKQLSFWSVFGSGHWVPEDNPEAMQHILHYLMEEDLSSDQLKRIVPDVDPETIKQIMQHLMREDQFSYP